jgi:hypothetical protein
MHITVASGCPASDRAVVGVSNPPPPLESSLLPSEWPTGGLVCEYYGLNGHPFALRQTTVMESTAANAYVRSVGRLRLGHLDGEVMSGPNDDGSATVVALDYPHAKTVDLWMTTTGCVRVSNGSISTSGTVPI